MDRIERKIIEIIEKNADKIIAFGDDIWRHAEIGYFENRTSMKFQEQMKTLGLETQSGIALTGVKSYLKDRKEGELCISLMGEMDALPIPAHPEANPENGAVHACGHNAQLTGVMGAALALADPEVKAALGGNVAFMGVPSEEASAAPEVKQQLINEGKIRYVGGKQEFVRLGAMDDISLTVGHHVVGDGKEYLIGNAASMGNISKHIVFTGKAGHPGLAHKFIDAQKAAILALQNIDQQREGLEHFYAWNKYHLHAAIMTGASASNVICDHAEVDVDIRGISTATLQDMQYRVDRAVAAAAMVTGAGMDMVTRPGYLGIQPIKDASIVSETFDTIDPKHTHNVSLISASGATDFGDLSNLMPLIQFHTGGHNGAPTHTVDFSVADPYEYYVTPAKCFALLAYKLLKDDGRRAKEIIAQNKPVLTKEQYLSILESFRAEKTIDLAPVPNFGLSD